MKILENKTFSFKLLYCNVDIEFNHAVDDEMMYVFKEDFSNRLLSPNFQMDAWEIWLKWQYSIQSPFSLSFLENTHRFQTAWSKRESANVKYLHFNKIYQLSMYCYIPGYITCSSTMFTCRLMKLEHCL